MSSVKHPVTAMDKQDSRHAPARQRLRDAIYALVLERGFDGFTVNDLLRRSGVARSSFYAHYRDKEDLLLHGFEEIGSPACTADPAAPDASQDLPDFAHWIFVATEDSKALTRSLREGSSRALVDQHLRNILTVQVREGLRTRQRDSTVPLELAVRFHVGALMSMWQWWVEHDFPTPARAMAEHFNRLMREGLLPPP